MKLQTIDIRPILVPFYSKACMDERVNMPEITNLLEYTRELFEKNYAFEVWNNIRLDRIKYDKEPFIEYLGELRHAFLNKVAVQVVHNIENICRWDLDKGFEEWMNEYAHAMTWWKDYVYEKLCQTDFQFTQEQKRKIEQYKELNAFVLDSKWAEAFPYFVELSENTQFNPLIRSNLKIIAGEIQLFWRPDYRDAIQFFQEAKKICPENPRNDRGMGEYYSHIGEYEKAKNHFLSAISQAPNDIDNYVGMGNTFLNEGNKDAAEKWYKDGVNINFLDYYSYSRIINLYNTPERVEEKKDIIETYIAKVTQFESYTLSNNSLYNFYRDVGLTYTNAKKYEKAIQYYKSAEELKPDFTAAKIDLGYTYSHAKQYDEAEKCFNRSLKADEEWNFDSYWAFAWLYEQIGNEKEDGVEKEKLYLMAIQKHQQCIPLRKGAWADRCHNLIGILYYKLAQYNDAIEHYEKAIEANPSEVVYYTNKRDALEKSNAPSEQIEKVLIETCNVMPSGAEHHNRLGVFYHDRNNLRQAIPHYTKAIEINPDSALYYENRGLAYSTLEEYENAEADYLQSCRLNPNDDIYNKLGVLYYRMGKTETALENYTKAIELRDNDPTYYENIGLAYEKLKDNDRAVESYEKAISLEKEKGIYLNRLGLFYYNKANDEKAVEFYKKAIEREPQNVTYLQNLALAYEQLRRYDEAEKIYQQLVNSDPKNINSSVRLAVIKMRKNIFDETVRNYLTRALEQQPNNLQYLEYMGHYYEKTGHSDEALKTYEKALAIDQTDEYFNNRAGIVLYTYGTKVNVEKAIVHYKKAIGKNEQAVYWQNLGLAYEQLDENEEAESAYLRSIEIDKQNDQYLNFLGVFYNNKIGDYKKAINYYEKAAAINQKPIYYNNIAYAYELLGNQKLAAEANAKALSLSGGTNESMKEAG